jgi:anti-anti-sigma regulatory factor
MLRITTHASPESLTFLVEGKLVGEWARELEQSWKQSASIRGHRALIVDLTDTLFIDEAGRQVLEKLFREGAFFRTAGPMTESIVSEITAKAESSGADRESKYATDSGEPIGGARRSGPCTGQMESLYAKLSYRTATVRKRP